jgi:predicted secreted protein
MRIIFLFILFYTGTAVAQKTIKNPVITTHDDGKTFTIKKGKTFKATLNQCVGCASVWKITKINNAKIRFISNTYSNKSCKNCTGGNIDNTFNFKAISPGSTTLVFEYFETVLQVTIKVQ